MTDGAVLTREVSHDGRDRSIAALHEALVVPMVRAGGEPSPLTTAVPSVALRVAAARLGGTRSPRAVTRTATWLGFFAVLERVGLDAAERFAVGEALLRSDRKPGFLPHGAPMWALARALDPESAEATARRLVEDPPRGRYELAAACLAAAPDAEIPPVVDHAELYRMPPAVGRSVLGRLPEARRRAWFDAIVVMRPHGATVLATWCASVLDLLPRDLLEPVVELARGFSASGPTIAAIEGGRGVPVGPDGVSDLVRPALDASITAKGAAAFRAGLAGVAEHATELRVAVTDAGELTSAERWDGAPALRREAITARICGALGERFRSDGELVVHRRKKLRLVVVPGRDGGPGPCLVGETGIPMAPKSLKQWVFRGPWRLPTEDEWRHARARGVGSGAAPEVCADPWAARSGPRVVLRGDARVSADAIDGDLVARPTVGLAAL